MRSGGFVKPGGKAGRHRERTSCAAYAADGADLRHH